MASINKKNVLVKTYTHEGGLAAANLKDEMLLRRAVMATMLGENQFYESGIEISKRITDLIRLVSPDKVAQIALDARNKMYLRHVPLLIIREMARWPNYKSYVAGLLENVIQRADDMTEFLALYLSDGKCPISAQVKKGLAKAFCKFNSHQLQKYNRDKAVKLKDVMFLTHPKPFHTMDDVNGGVKIPAIEKPKYRRGVVRRHTTGRGQVWRDLIDDKLETPLTWEVGISASKNSDEKRLVFEKLLTEKKLGAFALIRNLRKMNEVSVNSKLITDALINMPMDKILPFRFITAARYAPQFEPELETAMFKCLESLKDKTLPGKTVLLIDVSGSMNDAISSKSETSRLDAACGLAVLARELCEEVKIYSFSNDCVFIPARRGFALRDAILNSQSHSGTYLGKAMRVINKNEISYDRIILFTDEQSHDGIGSPKVKKAYCVNIASNEYGVGYGEWTHIDGFSEAILSYISEYEKLEM